MKKFLSILAGAAFFLVTSQLSAMQIKMKVGDVKIERAGKSFPLNKASEIMSKDFVVTADKSFVVFSFENGDMLKINGKSKVLITNHLLSSGGLTVVRGSLEAKFMKITRESPAKIYTPTTVASVRGTEFDVVVSDSGESRIQMKEGKLNVSNPSGEITVSDTECTDVLPGESPEESDSMNLDEWAAEKNKSFSEDPKYFAEGYEEQVDKMKKRSADNMAALGSANDGIQKANDVKQLDAVQAKVLEAKSKAEDDLMINEASKSLVEMVIADYSSDKGEILSQFESLKAECSKVMEQQQRNIEEINKVLQAYEKAKSEILEKHKSAVEEIKQKSKFDKK